MGAVGLDWGPVTVGKELILLGPQFPGKNRSWSHLSTPKTFPILKFSVSFPGLLLPKAREL